MNLLMTNYTFYYDESEHSRKINYQTITASNYYDNFVTMIVGWNPDKNEILQKYLAFENKYADRKNKNGEIKSTMFKQKQLEYGFASLNKPNIMFLNDFLSLFDKNTHIYFSVCSKIEYLILQLFKEYENNIFYNADFIKYSVTKTLIKYHPQKIIKCIYESPDDFIDELKKFLLNRIEYNKSQPELKKTETEAFIDAIAILNTISKAPNINWNYHMAFDGFKKYLQEKKIENYNLILDKEGRENEISKTLQSAIDVGLKNVKELDSKNHPGLRIADMLAGIISKLLKSIATALQYNSFDDGINKKVLSHKWFELDEDQLILYKKFFNLICVLQPAWYKSYSGIYADDLIVLNSLLNYMSNFESSTQIQSALNMQPEYFNAYACEQLNRYFERKSCKLPISQINLNEDESFFNQRNGKIYLNSSNNPMLPLHEGTQIFEVLSVGIDHKNIPLITVKLNGNSQCFRLPNDLFEWVYSLIGLASIGENILPSEVIFTLDKDKKIYVDLI